MPGAGQVPKNFCPEESLHFPTNFSIFSKVFSIRLPVFLTTFFRHLPKFYNFSRKLFNSSPKISDDLFKILVTYFFLQNWVVGCCMDDRGFAPSAPPLHATGLAPGYN